MNTCLGSNHLGMELLKSDMSNRVQYCQVSKKHIHREATIFIEQTRIELRKSVLLHEDLGIADAIIKVKILYLTD